MDFEQFEEEKPKIPTNLLVFVIVSALVIAFSIYYISKSGKQRPLTTEELVEGDTLSTDEQNPNENSELASSENETEEEELGNDETEILKNVKNNKSSATKKSDFEEIIEEKTTKKSSPTPTKTVNLEKKNTEVKKSQFKTSHDNTKKVTKSENIQGVLHVHTVRKNEFLSSIASMYNFPSKNIKELNGIDDDDLRVGQKIKVKVQTIHKVKKGEQLSKIAQNHGVKVADICKINGIKKDAQLKEGQKIIIPLKANK